MKHDVEGYGFIPSDELVAELRKEAATKSALADHLESPVQSLNDLVFRLYLETGSGNKVCRWLLDHHVPEPSGRKWTPALVLACIKMARDVPEPLCSVVTDLFGLSKGRVDRWWS
ncbi:recombinase family protein [Pseudogulbenkiania sp. MAI-1]|uniref:recombinase family protein n=1 Tax=Pseudogulbenkiania sp. MAI-1 TaxID=990370 RepID=UPI0004B1F354|nr:recombinase family protein [Pseudogulbenkiania sp. MAI-1]